MLICFVPFIGVLVPLYWMTQPDIGGQMRDASILAFFPLLHPRTPSTALAAAVSALDPHEAAVLDQVGEGEWTNCHFSDHSHRR